MAKTKSNKKKRVLLFLLIVFIVLLVVGVCIYFYLNKDKKEVVETKEAVILNSIGEYGITLSDLDSELYKTEYEILKKNLESDKINMEEYAKSIAKLFVIDLYTLNTKINKYDIGGAEEVYPNIVDNYKLNVSDTLYKYMEDNSTGKRRQTLPTVKTIKVDSIKPNKYKIDAENQTYDGYVVNLSWTYDNPKLGYDDEGEIYIINVDNKLYVVEKK
jgi:hypothetical protein